MIHPTRNKFSLVHGIVTGQGPIEGIKYGHAWVLHTDSNVVIDVTADIRMPFDIYKRIGQIEYYVVYTWKEAVKNCNKFGHYGAWDETISAAIHKGDDGAFISGSSPILKKS